MITLRGRVLDVMRMPAGGLAAAGSAAPVAARPLTLVRNLLRCINGLLPSGRHPCPGTLFAPYGAGGGLPRTKHRSSAEISQSVYLSVSLILTGRLGDRASNTPETGRWSSGGPAEETALVP